MATVVEGAQPGKTTLDIGALFASRYRITGILGRGGMGAVYAAQHTGTGQAVAIKTLLLDGEDDGTAVRRFFREAKLTASLEHPNTIRVFDFGQSDDGVYFLAMECLRGGSLADRLKKPGDAPQRLGETETIRIGCDVLRSLAEAHSVGLVHRDLKPANIFLHTLGSGETIVKVLDFGIAKSNDKSLTRTGTSLGTPSYMSPEQVMGSALDGRSDLYSLGVVLYGCVAGTLPFDADSSYSMMMKHISADAPDLRTLEGANVSSAFAAVVGRALAKKPEERFADAAAMREALEAIGKQSVAAPPAGRAPLPHPAPAAKAPPAPVAKRPLPRPAQAAPAPAPAPQPPAPDQQQPAQLVRKDNTATLALAVVGSLLVLGGTAAGLMYFGLIGDRAMPPAAGVAGPAAVPAAVPAPAAVPVPVPAAVAAAAAVGVPAAVPDAAAAAVAAAAEAADVTASPGADTESAPDTASASDAAGAEDLAPLVDPAPPEPRRDFEEPTRARQPAHAARPVPRRLEPRALRPLQRPEPRPGSRPR